MNRRTTFEAMLSVAFTSLVVSSAVHAQQSNCAELEAILKLDDYRSLAAEPLSIIRRGSDDTGEFATVRARAKAVLSSYSSCEIWIEAQRSRGGVEKETHSLNCDVRKTAAHGNTHRSAVLASAEPWRSCLGGWSEKITEDKGPVLNGAQFEYSRGDGRHRMTFTSSGMNAGVVSVAISLSK